MPETQNENNAVVDFISQLIIAHREPPDLARLKCFEFLAEPRKVVQLVRRARELLHHARCSRAGNWLQMFVQTHKVQGGVASPVDSHNVGGGNGRSVVRLSAHAWTL